MRFVPLVLVVLLPVAFTLVSVPAASADLGNCHALPNNTVCTYPNEPLDVLCFSDNGKQVACVFDPCGTTACF